jgi:hypothetical protein
MSKYFQHVAPSGTQFFWRPASAERYATVQVHINLNLLATAVGDVPTSALSLVPPQNYNTGSDGGLDLDLQPFVEMQGTTPVELSIGPELRKRLDDPIGSQEKLNLSLPFYDPALGIGDNGGGWFRVRDGFHGGWDVTPKSQTSAADLFEVCAAASGVVEGLVSKNQNSPIVIKHGIGSSAFLTIYQHLDLRACPLNKGDPVARGQFLAKIAPATGADTPDPRDDHMAHLHFMVAIRGPSFTHISGSPASRKSTIVPALWYVIDSFGVYDVHQHTTDTTAYNYVPDKRPDCFSYRIQGANHTIQWAAEPLIETIPITKITSSYLSIIRMQFRSRRGSYQEGVPPAEVDQCLVWLEGIQDFFSVPMSSTGNDTIELRMIDFLTQCFHQKQKVRAEYYPIGAAKFISAVWANE